MAGEQITTDYQVELSDLLIGVHGESGLAGEIGGLLPTSKPNDVGLDHADGSYIGPQYRAAKIITVPFWFDGMILDEVTDAWDATPPAELHIRVPVFGHIYLVGSPRGLTQHRMDLDTGTFLVTGTFFAGDPIIHTASETSS